MGRRYLDNYLKEYVEKNIIPIYEKNKNVYGIDYVNYVIRRSIKIAQDTRTDIDIAYTAAAFSEIGYFENHKNREIISARMFMEDNFMKNFFSDKEREIIKEAIEDHRSVHYGPPRSVYGKILSTAGKDISINAFIRESYYKHLEEDPNMPEEQIFARIIHHARKKFGPKGFGRRSWIKDKKFNKFLKDINKLSENPDKFKEVFYIIVNQEKSAN